MGDYDDYGGRSSSRYDDGPRRYKNTRTRPRRDDDADFVEETTFIERGKGRPPQELVYRGRDRDDSVEDIPRDFSPPAGRRPRGYEDYGGPQRRARSVTSRRDRYDDDDSDEYAAGAGGAAAGYAAGRAGRNRGNGRRRQDSYYSDGDSNSDRGEKKKKKSGIESTLESLGLGGVVGAITGNKDRSRSRSREGRGGRSRSRNKGNETKREWAQAAQAALIAGAIEAFRSRGAPGPWTGEKGKRIATAAIASGGIDKLVDRDPDEKSKLHLVEAVLGGLAANRLANGPPREGGSRSRSSSREGGRSRSRSVFSRYRKNSRGRRGSSDDEAEGTTTGDKIKDLAAGGVLAGVGKQIYDRFRSKSRKRRDSSSGSSGSEDSYRSRSRRGNRDVGAYSQSRGGPPDEGAVVGPRGRGGAAAANGGGEQDGSSSDSLSSTDMEEKRKKMRGKEYLTAALASIATIHAAHGVYQSMEASDKRHKLVAEGEMSPEEARKKRSKAWLQDAAAVGIAALGIKGAYSEWNEMNEQRHEIKELEERKRGRDKRKKRRMEMGLPPIGPTGRTNGRYAPERCMSGANGEGSGGGGQNGSRRPRDDGPYYNDGNPYGGGRLPPPPTGYNR